jgi:hypothetical protein
MAGEHVTSLSVAGRRVAVNPRVFPALMSKHIGLRTYPHLTGIPGISCPPAGIQQFVNDHFQTGDFTGWTQTNLFIDNGTCVGFTGPLSPYIGSYDAASYVTYPGPPSSLQQILKNPVPVACITSASIFQITYQDLGIPCDTGTYSLDILYSDGTNTLVDLPMPATWFPSWYTFDLKPYLQTGKSIKSVLFTCTDNGESCNVHVGQISLII